STIAVSICFYSTGRHTVSVRDCSSNVSSTDPSYHVIYDSNAHTATGTATGVKGETLTGLSLTGTTHTAAGDYPTDPWTFTDSTEIGRASSRAMDEQTDEDDATISVTRYQLTHD